MPRPIHFEIQVDAPARAITFYDRAPHCPVEQLPPGAIDVRAANIARFFYALRFRMPA